MTTQAAAMEALPGAEGGGLVTRVLHPAITTDASSFEAAAAAAERVAVNLEDPGPECRTRLATFVLSSIEAQLERLGAAPRGWTARDSLEMVLSDQLYRSRLLGAGGIALRFGALDGIADGSGALSLEDSHMLRRMFDLAELEPLQVFLPEPSARLCVAGAPRPLAEWLPAGSRSGRVASIEYESVASDAATSTAPAAGDSLVPPQVEAFVCAAEPRAASAGPTHTAAELTAPAPARELGENERPTVVPSAPPSELVAAEAEGSPAGDPAQPPAAPAAPAPPASEELEAQRRRCATWLAQLRSMNGPKQHASVERAFVTAYVPLSREVAMGRAPEEARKAVETWAEGFAQSYAAAFKTLNGHARRPTMVRDIFDVAQRWLNQSRARSLQLLLVDGMRFDLAQRLNEAIEQRLAGCGVCRDQVLLWAALPSNSGAQRLADPGSTRPSQPAKPAAASSGGRSATGSVETVRVGARELFRVDQLAEDLSRAGEAEAARTERLATLLADTIVPWLKERPPESLVVLFGDHGFHWHASPAGTSPAQRGGALPEQVLVAASAWLLGITRPKAGTAPGLH
jgi:hypothetical protein